MVGLWRLLQREDAPEPGWWLETYVAVDGALEVDAGYRPRGGEYLEYVGRLCQFVHERAGEAYRQGQPVLEACDSWYSGAYLLETVPSVLTILMRHGDDPEEAIVRAVNDTKDNDTIAAIVGAAKGALYGVAGLPRRRREKLLGRTAREDDGVVLGMLGEARGVWWGG